MANAEPSPAWERQVASLHYWYLQNGLAEMAVESDRVAHAKAKGYASLVTPDGKMRKNYSECVW